MTRALCVLLLGLGGGLLLAPARPADAPPLEEVLGLLRAHLVGATEAELNAAAVHGLLDRLQPRVFLVTNLPPETAPTEPPPPLLARTNVFENSLACLRVGRVAAGLAEAVRTTLESWRASAELQGVVLDLRFAGGEDLEAAAAVADLFVAEPRPLIEWGTTRHTATAKTNALPWRLAVLVNRETRGAAEALAAALHELRLALLLGRPTAGEAAVYREFPLSTGQHLRLAVAAVRVGPGARPLSFSGLAPDIRVEIADADERRFIEDPFYQPASAGPGARVARLTEADLVRMHREGPGSAAARSRRPEPAEGPRVTDPVLARALDLLKSLAILEAREP